MERNNWNNRRPGSDYRDRDRFRNEQNRIDEDRFRGAYRFDTDSRHHNETTYDGFDMREQRRSGQRNSQSGYESVPDYYSAGQSYYFNEAGNPHNEQQNYRNQGNYRPQQDNYRREDGYRRATNVSGNFDGDYGPDRYGAPNRDENYGNMAGSLSFGYDGYRNADFSEDREYDPLSGRRRSYHGNYTSRHPEGNENLGRNRDRRNDYDRY